MLNLTQALLDLPAQDYFQILKVQHTSTAEEVKQAFYRESRCYHPDRFYTSADPTLKLNIQRLYKRIVEAYYVLHDDVIRKQYLSEITGPDRSLKLRWTVERALDSKKATEGNPKARTFFQMAVRDIDAGQWVNAERNLRTALTYDISNPLYLEKLKELQRLSISCPKNDQ